MKTEYRVIRSKRRSTSIEINRHGEVIVRCPLGMPQDRIEALIASHWGWIENHRTKIPERTSVSKLTDDEVQTMRVQAGAYFPERVAYFAARLGVTYGRITLRTQRSKWGSCSSKGNLNFNILLMLAPRDVLDYIVVHELCHRKHLNHSAAFWAEVEGLMPDYREKEKWLKEHGTELMMRLWD